MGLADRIWGKWRNFMGGQPDEGQEATDAEEEASHEYYHQTYGSDTADEETGSAPEEEGGKADEGVEEPEAE